MPDQGLVTAATGGKFMFRYLNPLKRPRFHFQVPGRRPCKRCDGFRQAVRPFLPLAHERLPKLRTHEDSSRETLNSFGPTRKRWTHIAGEALEKQNRNVAKVRSQARANYSGVLG